MQPERRRRRRRAGHVPDLAGQVRRCPCVPPSHLLSPSPSSPRIPTLTSPSSTFLLAAAGGNCKDVSYNMRTAMQYFRDTISSNGGDLLLSLGMYNGWYEVRPPPLSPLFALLPCFSLAAARLTPPPSLRGLQGLTEESATAARWGSCCRCQNNLDYLQSFVNGFILGHDGHEVGTYHNLDVC